MSSPSRRSSFRLPSELRGPLLAGCFLFAASWAFVCYFPPFQKWIVGDIRFYDNWASLLVSHKVPYRDFRIEYPPLALPVFMLPVYIRKLFGYHGIYPEWFRAELLFIGLATQVVLAYALAALRASRRRAYAALCFAGVVPALLGPIAFSRYDFWPTLFAIGAVAALAARRPTLACGIAAAGAAAKVFPIVIVPLALIELWRRGRWRGVALGVAVTLAVLAVFIVPFAVIAPDGVSWAVHRQLNRPLQVESLAAVFFAIAHVVGDVHLHVVKSAGSDNLVGGGPDAASTALTVATVLALLAVYVAYTRSRGTRYDLAVASVAAVTAYIAFSKVFSPQYLVWLFPLVPLARTRSVNVLFAVIVGMTQIWEPFRYGDYYRHFPPWLTTLVLVRDLLVVVLLVLLVRSVRDADELDARRAAVV